MRTDPHAGVPRPTIRTLRLSALLRQPPDAIAFLEAILGGGKTGLIKLHVKDGQARAWAFSPGGTTKHLDAGSARAVE